MKKALDGVKVVITRAKEQAGEFAGLLGENGAETVFFPTIEFREPDDLSVIDDAIDKLSADNSAYDWVVFTSANGVRFFYKRVKESGKDGNILSSVKVGVVGPKTASALRSAGVEIDLVPEDYRAEGLILDLQKVGIYGKKVLIPRALVGRDVLPEVLRQNGAFVTLAPVYETVTPENTDKSALMAELFNRDDIILTFTSGSTAKNFFRLFNERELRSFMNRAKIAVISPVTKNVVEKLGFNVDIVPDKYTAKDLAYAIINYKKR